MPSPTAGGVYRTRLGEGLILAYLYPPNREVGSLRPYRFAKYLPAYGIRTHVVTASAQDSDAPANVHFVADPVATAPGLWGRLARRLEWMLLKQLESVGWVPGAYAAARKVIESAAGPWSLISTSPPPVTNLTALILKRRYGSDLRWVADFRDPINAGATGFPGLWNRRLEAAIFRSADCIIANTDSVADMWRKRYPQWEHKISLIWNGYDPEEDVRALPLPPRGYKTIGHIGDIYGGRHPHRLLESLQRLLDAGVPSVSRIRLELVGELDWNTIPDPGVLRSLVERGVAVLSDPDWTAAQMRRAMSEVDALLLLDVGSGLHVPSKIFVYLRIGRPILAITSRQSPSDRILARSGVPHVCLYPEDSAAEVDSKVLRFLEMSSDPVPASDWFYNEFDGRRQTGTLAAMLTGGAAPAQAPPVA